MMARCNMETEREIRDALRLTIKWKWEVDWDTVLDRDKLAAAYKQARGMRKLAKMVGLTDNRVKAVLVIHDIPLNKRGGAYQSVGKKKKEKALPPLDLSAVHAIGEGYSKELKRLLLFHASGSVRACTPKCPNVVVCWDAPFTGSRPKRASCTLRDHLIAVGVLNAKGYQVGNDIRDQPSSSSIHEDDTPATVGGQALESVPC